MKKHTYLSMFLAAALALPLGSASAQDKKDNKWNVEEARGPQKEITVTTDEGTWMSLDVSPDGKEIVFDMLGDIYIMPISGGKAKLLRSGRAYEVQPRFSPDGKFISFTSDAGGGDNIWVMKRDGSDARQITKENFRLLNNAVWTPDGEYLIARKHFTASRSLGAGEMWMYHKSGGSGVQLTKRKNDQQDAGEPVVSPDGKYVYFSEDMSGGTTFEYNKDPNGQIYVIRRVDRNTGEIENVVTGNGGSVRPVISRDGKQLAFVRRVRTKSVLFIHDLKTGEQWPIYDQLSNDQQEAWAIFGVYPYFSWTPDNKSLVFWANGKINKIDVASQKVTNIPFEATATHHIAEAVRHDFSKEGVSPAQFTAKAIRHAVTSPDGKLLVFNAAGHIYKKELPNGKPERVTNGKDFEFYPAFSPDGKTLVFSTWDDENLGALVKVDIRKKNAKPVKLTFEKGFYTNASFSPNGKLIVYSKDGGNNHMGYAHGNERGTYYMTAEGKNPTLIMKNGFNPLFNASSDRIFFTSGGGGKYTFKSVNLNGNDERTHYTSTYTDQFYPSPDNKWLAFVELFNGYVVPFSANGAGMELSAETKAVPVARFTKDAGTSVHWSGDSKKVNWVLGDEYFSNDLKDRFAFLEGAPEKLPAIDTTGIKIGLEFKTDKPQGKVAFTNARIITMKGDEVIEGGTIVVDGNRIVSVGKGIAVPKDAKVIDASGKTIMPGLVDVHAHLGTFRNGMSPKQQWSYLANLAYGVTTTHDPSSTTEMVFSQSEAVKAGHMVGPRIYSTGTILYGADGNFKAVINSLDDARSHLRRIQAAGGFSVKSYNQPRREQRQQVIQAARELNMTVVPEGGSTFFHNMSMILDGHSGIEHNIPIAPLYKDVVEVWKASNTGYTPTLIVNYGATSGEYYWYQNTKVWEKERLLKFTPRSVIDGRSRFVMQVPDEEYRNGYFKTSEACKALTDAGVKVNLGAHGQLQGLGAHWELWMLQQGGMTNMEALRAATLNGAEYLGMGKDLGSLEAGKLADLIVLDQNPLENIQNSEHVRYTMVNGRLFDAATLNEVGNYERKPGKFWWENNKYASTFDWHEGTDTRFEGIAGEHCTCRH
ncbi:amidohydrolase family protein [Pontibacter ramchanderi]|uniref:Imidazolonepropionase-like amidohydrolase n=1 Tax=Pontibacter ramchanderi TaxID=1179743 RepID=A0A2N3U8W8_9BACT|nr:amidohydrolase family protein [Pontibacter ramchanderi]PKV63175.1 imidazolonepropionase-like amidohydrolase [Pontibacter ramchanderi]